MFFYKPEFFRCANFIDSSSIGFVGAPGRGFLAIGFLCIAGLGPVGTLGFGPWPPSCGGLRTIFGPVAGWKI